MMTLDEAIEHCKEKSCSNTECAREHKQLAEWLEELKEYKKIYGELNQAYINAKKNGSAYIIEDGWIVRVYPDDHKEKIKYVGDTMVKPK